MRIILSFVQIMYTSIFKKYLYSTSKRHFRGKVCEGLRPTNSSMSTGTRRPLPWKRCYFLLECSAAYEYVRESFLQVQFMSPFRLVTSHMFV